MDIWKKVGLLSTTIIVLLIPISIVIHSPSTTYEKKQADFVGGKECISCHQQEYNLWKGSDHDQAMMIANDSTVLGDFNNVEVKFRDKINKFYKRDGKFFVYTEGIGGEMQEFEIKYTFGVRPLQQYLIPFEKGRYQCLPIAWDTDKQRWFDMAGMVYSAEELKPDSWFYWTNQSQNWNGMCAECHSTYLQKNYNLQTDSYNTTWSDINVNCEACHGPGSEHLDWAKLPEGSRSYDGNLGLVLKTRNTTSKQYIEACAPCHSRRTSLGTDDHRSNNYYNNYRPQLVTPPLYFSDGQILDEVYVFGSFTQSKMYMHDVRCNDCHDSHSLKLKFDGNALCTQCHRAEEYDTYQHHFHKYANQKGEPVKNKFGDVVPVGEGAQCKSCHMPARYYMGVDYRRDHSFRIPRPDLSIKYDIPNTCNDCHSDKSFQWSEDYIKKYYGERKKFTYGTVLSDGFLRKENADTSLIHLITNDLYPEIVRATAIQYLNAFPNMTTWELTKSMLDNPEPIIREAAINSFNANNVEDFVNTLSPVLNDPEKIVRFAAANRLFELNKDYFTDSLYSKINEVMDEYYQAILYTADFPSGRFNLANYFSRKGDYSKAVQYYEDAIKIDNQFYPAKSNLALLYYSQGKLDEAENLFLDLIKNHQEYTEGFYYLGLLYAEEKQFKESANYLEKALKQKNPNPRVYYNLGLVYQQLNENKKAESTLLEGNKLQPYNFDLVYALSNYYLKQKNFVNALSYANELKKMFPSRPEGQGLINFIKEQMNLP
jgi:tetratricopeptide (TPR) repeat protein